MPYRTLDRTKITKTAEKLEARISERFDDSSLARVAAEISAISRDLGVDAQKMERPLWWLRLVLLLLVAGSIYVFTQVGTFVQFSSLSGDATDLVQGFEAAINMIVFFAIALYTLFTLEKRIKRERALKSLHTLRSIIHIIDMHQLTKDPAAFSGGYTATASSPKRVLSPHELARYLDYCSELLSITGKVAALYAQALGDDVVVGAVNDIESLGTNLSRKIWQKIMLIEDQA